MKQQLNEIKRMQQLAGLINESQLDEAVDTLNIQKDTSEEGNKQITLSVLGGGWEENEITFSSEEAKALIELAKEFSGNRNNTISKGVNTADKNSTQSTISIQPDKLSLIIGRKEGSTYKGYDMPIESSAGYLKAQQSIIYQIVDELGKNLNESTNDISELEEPEAEVDPKDSKEQNKDKKSTVTTISALIKQLVNIQKMMSSNKIKPSTAEIKPISATLQTMFGNVNDKEIGPQVARANQMAQKTISTQKTKNKI